MKKTALVILAGIMWMAFPATVGCCGSVFDDKDFFPICVWLQNPGNALRYRQAGFNTYVGLWKGPTEVQLAQLKAAGMKVICSQNDVARKHLDDETIIAWMHGDEPDNAQSLGAAKGYGPPIPPAKIIDDYHKVKAVDASRPVMLNLGQGVAWDGWHGRGVRTNHPEDYREYVKGCDIASFDIYPAVHSSPQVAGNLWYVARGVERLVEWTEGRKPVFNCIECTHISNPDRKATPHEVRAEVWMSIISGSRGLIYFVHQFEPVFNESALLSDVAMLSAVTEINGQVAELAPVINSPSIGDILTVAPGNTDIPVATAVRRRGGSLYVFAVCMRDASTEARFSLRMSPTATTVEVLREERTLRCDGGVFTDSFGPWDVHLYKIDMQIDKAP